MTVSAVMSLPPPGEALFGLGPLLFRDVNLSGHGVMTDPAKLVADDAELAALGRRQRNHMLVARVNGNVDVDGLQREAVHPVDRRNMDPVTDALLQLENGPPLPQPAEQIDIGPGFGLDHRYTLLLAHLVFLGELVDFRLIGRRCNAVGLLAEILLADEMPRDHEAEHEQAPEEGDHDPDQFDPLDRLVPPNSSFGRCDGHVDLPFSKGFAPQRGWVQLAVFISPEGPRRFPSRPRSDRAP